MTDHKPKPCHYDRLTDQRLTRDGDPCPQPHCVLCQRRHLDTSHPLTCDDCIGDVRNDLFDLLWDCRHLRWQAVRGSTNAPSGGRLIAAAPIPGGDAMVMLARAGAAYDDLIWDPKLADDHRGVATPPLVTLLGWEHQWRTYFSQKPRAAPAPGQTIRHPLTAVVHYLAEHLHKMAQAGADHEPAPDWPGMARSIGDLRRQLDAVLHDEQAGEQGVACFECGDTLVRRFGKPRPCRHRTPAREHLERIQARAERGRAWLALLATYPELGPPWYTEIAASRPPTSAETSAARRPCEKCVVSGQGGITDPTAGQSWECPGCRKAYTPAEYNYAVRNSLIERHDGWSPIGAAAAAATILAGRTVSDKTLRGWVSRGWVSISCEWRPGIRFGVRMVLWSDVAREAMRLGAGGRHTGEKDVS